MNIKDEINKKQSAPRHRGVGMKSRLGDIRIVESGSGSIFWDCGLGIPLNLGLYQFFFGSRYFGIVDLGRDHFRGVEINKINSLGGTSV